MAQMPPKVNPIKAVRLNGTARSLPHSGRRQNQRVTVVLPTSLIERLRNAVYWTEQSTLARLIADAVEDLVADMEQANGGPFAPRLSQLKRGRPSGKPASVGTSRSAASRG
jgi:hypothetical protein